ncbi:MAG: zinc-ribbon domain-containing protein, partial [Candidatus Hodarchaeales archaeon]
WELIKMQTYPEAQHPTDSPLPVERPRDVFEMVSEAFNLYGKGFVNLWIPFLIVSIIVGIISGWMNMLMTEMGSDLEAGETENLGQIIMGYLFLAFLGIGIGIAGSALATAMVVVTVQRLAENQEPPLLSEAFEMVQQKWVKLVLGSILYGIVVGIGFLLLIIPGLIFMTWFYLFAVCIVLEDKEIQESFSRSKELVQGDGWHAFGLVLVSFILIGILQAVITFFVFIFMPFSSTSLIGTVVNNAAGSIVAPLGGIMTTLLYFDLKARKAMAPAPYGYARTVAPAPYPATDIPPGVAAVFCSECGAAVAPETTFCPNCGSKVQAAPPEPAPAAAPTAAFCPECGASLPSDMKVGFCPNCGAKVQ